MARPLVWSLTFCVMVITSIKANSLLYQNSIDPDFGWDPSAFPLKTYRAEDLVQCLQTLSLQSGNRHLHFVFVGDSRVRQHFYSFVQLLPDYDFRWSGAMPDRRIPIHVDMDVESELLRAWISFRWRPFIDHDLFDQFVEWTKPLGRPPNFVLLGNFLGSFTRHEIARHLLELPVAIEANSRSNSSLNRIASKIDRAPQVLPNGISAWYMLPDKGGDRWTFTRRLELLEPKIRWLARTTRILWLHQPPIVEMFGNSKSDNTAINTEKMDRYNSLARHILRKSGAIIWDSGHFLGAEYVRSCLLNRRQDPHKFSDCYDFIHTGYAVLSRGMQFLVHDLCA